MEIIKLPFDFNPKIKIDLTGVLACSTSQQVSEPTDDEQTWRKGVGTKDEPTLQEILDAQSLKPDQLPKYFKNRVQKIFNYVSANTSEIDSDLHPEIDFVYQVWHATRNLPSGHPLSAFTSILDSYDSFVENYAQGTSRKVKGNLIKRIDWYVSCDVPLAKEVTATPEDSRLRSQYGIYNYDGQWVRLPCPYLGSHDTADFVDRTIVEEVAQAEATEPNLRADLFHATGSASLDGIAKHQAILSAEKVLILGEPVKTGEYNFYISRNDHYLNGGKNGLNNVYTSEGVSTSYADARWFDEFHVVFGISAEEQKRYLRKQRGLEKVYFTGFANEGIAIGSEVPLENVGIVYGEARCLPRLEEWTARNVPHARVASLEAHELIRRSSRERLSIPELMGRRPVVVQKSR